MKEVKELIEAYAEKYNEFTSETLKRFSNGENLVFSPLSIFMLLSMAADSVNGAARQEILDVIGSERLSGSYGDTISKIQRLFTDGTSSEGKKEGKGSLVSANAVCVRNDLKEKVNPEYLRNLKKYNSELFASENMIGDVNAWVKNNTKGMIESIADDSMRKMVMCLLNALAFDAEWKKKYDEDDIYDSDFTNADGSISEVQMLDSKEQMYVENDRMIGFIKPYKDPEYEFMALLPKRKAKSAMAHAIRFLNISELYSSMSYKKVIVSMPEFCCDSKLNLKEYCKELGINTLFTDDADFSPASRERLKVDAILHKAHVEVDRKGTKAAAVTMAGVVCAGAAVMEEAKIVRLDRPFIYAVMHKETKLPVFVGIMNKSNRSHYGDL